MTRHVTCVVLALLTTALAAIAKDVKIGATSIDLTAPSGYCELRENNANEARVLKGLQDTTIRNQLLAAYADCQQLANYRPGKNPLLDDFAVYWTATSLMNVALRSSGFSDIFEIVAADEAGAVG
jgi:hypothetical protein